MKYDKLAWSNAAEFVGKNELLLSREHRVIICSIRMGFFSCCAGCCCILCRNKATTRITATSATTTINNTTTTGHWADQQMNIIMDINFYCLIIFSCSTKCETSGRPSTIISGTQTWTIVPEQWLSASSCYNMVARWSEVRHHHGNGMYIPFLHFIFSARFTYYYGHPTPVSQPPLS